MMEKILEQIFSKLNSMDEKIGSLTSDVSTLKSDVSTLKSDVSTLKSDVSTLKSDMQKFARKLDAVFEQTGLLTEFKTEVIERLNKIASDNLSLQHIIGEHDVAIRSMQRSVFFK
ncbi:MAG TPA: hypothetical protein PLY40_03175 [Bacillota bacterium]|nr:hypothetical protein [Bacillota bacterium]